MSVGGGEWQGAGVRKVCKREVGGEENSKIKRRRHTCPEGPELC
jgi:hypothetical protein